MDALLSPEPGLILWTILTFFLLLVLLRLFAWKPILGIIEERERMIRDSLEASRRAREEAETALAENRRILAQARDAASTIVQQGAEEAEEVKAGILEKARNEHDGLIRRGRDEIERETRSAIQEIRGVTADLALAAAEKLIETRMDEEINRKLVESYLRDLEKSGSRRN